MPRFLTLSLVCFFLAGCAGVGNVKTIVEKELLVRRLAPGVYQHITYLETNSLGTVACNGMVYARGGEAIIFDTPSTEQGAKSLYDWIQSDLKCSVKAVVINHFHIDCLGSLAYFHQYGIPSYASAKTIELALADQVTAVPKLALEAQPTLTVAGRPVINQFFGAGHTQDNIVSYLPEEKVLFGGCMIKSLVAGKGNLADADVVAWPHSVAKVKAAFPDVKWVVPGHGAVGDTALLNYTIQMFE